MRSLKWESGSYTLEFKEQEGTSNFVDISQADLNSTEGKYEQYAIPQRSGIVTYGATLQQKKLSFPVQINVRSLSESQYSEKCVQLAEAFCPVREGKLTYTCNTITRSINAYPQRTPLFKSNDGCQATFLIELVADSPYWVGDEYTDTIVINNNPNAYANKIITNGCNFNVYPTISITGSNFAVRSFSRSRTDNTENITRNNNQYTSADIMLDGIKTVWHTSTDRVEKYTYNEPTEKYVYTDDISFYLAGSCDLMSLLPGENSINVFGVIRTSQENWTANILFSWHNLYLGV